MSILFSSCPVATEVVVSVRNGRQLTWVTMGPASGGAYECYAHFSSFLNLRCIFSSFFLSSFLPLFLAFSFHFHSSLFLIPHLPSLFLSFLPHTSLPYSFFLPPLPHALHGCTPFLIPLFLPSSKYSHISL